MMRLLAATLVTIRLIWSDGTTTDVPVPTSTTVTVTSTTTSTTVPSTTTTTLVSLLQAPTMNAGGYAWLTGKPGMRFLLGEGDAQGSAVAGAKAAARANGIPQTLLHYFSISDIDDGCQCFDSRFYFDVFSHHPEWTLHDGNGARVFTNNRPAWDTKKVWASDIGNPAFVDAWVGFALGVEQRWGWDGVWADNVIRCNGFGEWSGRPMNPRTRAPYTCDEYRRDMATALWRVRGALHVAGKFVMCNQSGAWRKDDFANPHIQETAMMCDGLWVEDCLYDYGNPPRSYTEAERLQQLAYMDFGNRNGKAVICQGYDGIISDPTAREFVLAFELLTKEGYSGVGQINSASAYWPQLDLSLGLPALGGYECVSAAGVVSTKGTSGCPGLGMAYRRRFEKGVVVVNLTTSPRTIPLGRTSSCGTSVSLSGSGGRICN